MQHLETWCRGRGDQDSIEAYVSPAMLQDPWAALMKQHLGQHEQQAAIKPLPAHAVDSINAGQGHSLSDAFAAAEQVCCCLHLDLATASVCTSGALQHMGGGAHLLTRSCCLMLLTETLSACLCCRLLVCLFPLSAGLSCGAGNLRTDGQDLKTVHDSQFGSGHIQSVSGPCLLVSGACRKCRVNRRGYCPMRAWVIAHGIDAGSCLDGCAQLSTGLKEAIVKPDAQPAH